MTGVSKTSEERSFLWLQSCTWLWIELSLRFGKHRSTTAVLSRKSLSGSQVPLRDLMPGLSHFQFWILFDTRFDDIDVICRLGGPYSKKL